MEWRKNNFWRVAIGIGIVVLFVGIVFFLISSRNQNDGKKTAEVVPSVGTADQASQGDSRTREEKLAGVPAPPDVDPDLWPKEIVFKTPDGMDRVIVSFKYGTDQATQRQIIERYGARILVEFASDPYIKSVFVPESQREAFGKDTSVYRLDDDEPKKMLQEQKTPQGVTNVKAPDAWKKKITGSPVKVCVIDTGVDEQNKDLKTRIVSKWSYFDKQGISVDDQKLGHGTHVAGTIAASDDSAGVVGVAPTVALCIKRVFDDRLNTTGAAIIQAIEDSVSEGAQVINFSAGSVGGSKSDEKAQWAVEQGVVFVAAAGNPSDRVVIYPAKLSAKTKGLIAVSAVDNANVKRADYPNGSEITLVAPGIGVLSDCPPTGEECTDEGPVDTVNRTALMSGSSMATPHVTGAVALLLSQPIADKYDVNKDKKWQPAEVSEVLTSTASDLGATGKDDRFGYGLVNVEAALAAAAPLVCTGTPPGNVTLCAGDDTGLTTGVPVSLVPACTDAVKCEYACSVGFHIDAGACVANTTPPPPPPVPTPTPTPTPTAGGFSLVPCGRTVDDERTPNINEAAPCTVCHLVIGAKGVIDYAMQVMTYIAIAVIVAMAIWYIVSAGNSGMMQTAKGGIFAAFIGFAVMLSAWLIVNTVVFYIFGASIPGLEKTGTGFNFTCNPTSSAGTASGNSSNPGSNSGGGVGNGGGSGTLPTDCAGYQAQFESVGSSTGVSPLLLRSIAAAESSCKPNTTSSHGACGLMQLMPSTVGKTCEQLNSDPNLSIQLAANYFKTLQGNLNAYKGTFDIGNNFVLGLSSVTVAGATFDVGNDDIIAAYNAGSGNKLNGQGQKGPFMVSADCPAQGGKSIPAWQCPINAAGFSETQNYVRKVQGFMLKQ